MQVQYGLGDIVHRVTRFDGTIVSNSYDGQARLVKQTLPGQTNTFSYTPGGLPSKIGNASGVVTNTYDLAGRLLWTKSTGQTPLPVATQYAYDPVGNVQSAIGINGTNSYSYDAAERLVGLQANRRLATPLAFTNTFNPYNGMVAQVSNITAGITASYSFDALERVTNIVWRNASGGLLRRFGYGYNTASMITNVIRENTAENVSYQYDSLDRLTSASASYLTVSYGWDLAGNPTSRVENATNTTYTLGTGNRLASWTGGSYGYDAAGCITNISRGSVNHGLTWDGAYRLTGVATNGTAVETYACDPLGRKVQTTTAGETTYHVYDGLHVIADLDYSGGLVRSYTPGPGVDNWLAMTVYTGTVVQTYYYLTDHLGTVHALTDGAGAIVESYRYDPFGRVLGVYDASGAPIANQKSAIGNRYLWQGREYSWTTGLYHFRARWYDPVTGRWLSKDPIGISGGLNQYVAFGNNPVMFRDPFGLSTVYITMKNGSITLNDPTCAELRKALNSVSDGSITRFVIAGHGGIEGIYIGKPGSFDEAGVIYHPYVSKSVVYNDDLSSFADSIRAKLSRDAEVFLNGCDTAREWHWPFPKNKTNIAKQLSIELKGHRVTGNRGFAISNEPSVPGRRDLSFQLFQNSRAVGVKRTYLNGQ